MGTILNRCSCCYKETSQLLSDCKLSDIPDNDKKMIHEKPLFSLSFFTNDNNKRKRIVLIQKVIRQFLGRQTFNNELKRLIQQFDNNISPFGTYICTEEMTERSSYINKLEHEVFKNSFQLSDKEKQSFPLIFLKQPIKFKDNSIYEGNWNYKGEKHGHGIVYQEDGSKIEGIWRNNYLDGRGRFIDAKGNYFEGQWKRGIVDGKGKYVLANGSTYEGQWENDHQEGFGKESFLDGSKYEGLYHNGKKEGIGIFTWPNGSYYQGHFSESMLKGEGVFHWKNGRQYEGQWENNQLNGFGIFSWPNGKKYIGEYKNNKKEGKGTYYWNTNTYYKGYWLNNNQHGEGEFFCNGTMTKGYFRYGKLIKCSSKDFNEIINQENILSENTKQDNIKANTIQQFLFD